MQALPPGEMQELSCAACGGTTFTLKQEVRDGEVEAFHSVCSGCGKRGYLQAKVVVNVKREFLQFMDPPPNLGQPGGGFVLEFTPGTGRKP
jgi:hypothetical protein